MAGQRTSKPVLLFYDVRAFLQEEIILSRQDGEDTHSNIDLRIVSVYWPIFPLSVRFLQCAFDGIADQRPGHVR